MRSLFLFLFATVSASAQPISAGLKVGVPLTDFFSTVENVSSSVPNRFIVGAMAELRLPFGLGVEVDALYRRVHYEDTLGNTAIGVTMDRTTANSWEFPILGKYRFPMRIARPYVEAGIAFDTLQGLSDTVTQISPLNTSSTHTTSTPTSLQNNSTKGFVIGAGLDVHAIVIHISPEIRYTRWGASQFNLSGVLSSNQNQAEFLVGITF
ncbi:MAG TPA: outer membrane beta-barrel protein [Bryobacteraceae bacterium]|nr:outer membrane beta-barrel protein [Bryobacteraceae bacterium]